MWFGPAAGSFGIAGTGPIFWFWPLVICGWQQVPTQPESPEMIGYLYCADCGIAYPFRNITFASN
ncbi:hypothetical protein BKP64_18885 [Marinobacter salinus]|uniref:Uncharacterized protein n=1 Tax=Marinobacter salinus TaxID=1874317 RepID=A0A1D9GR04_9GAMM|nr:hypothetical protein BKP64_18885 [Marinobacter salinus]